jgi:hypothetical protein
MVMELRKMCLDILGGGAGTIAELGCYYGESTIELARHATVVFAIDPWEESYMGSADMQRVSRDFQETMGDVEKMFDATAGRLPNVVKFKRRQEDAVHAVRHGSLCMVYCDAVHSLEATASAIDLWTPKVAKGMYMAGHDYSEEFPGVVAAVDERRTDSFRLWGDGNWAYRL